MRVIHALPVSTLLLLAAVACGDKSGPSGPNGGPSTADIVLSRTALDFVGTGGAPPPAQTLDITSSGQLAVTGLTVGAPTYQGAPGWITGASLSATTTPAVLTITTDPRSLAPGNYTATIRVASTASNASGSGRDLTVRMAVTHPPRIALSTATVSVAGGVASSAPAPVPVQVTNGGGTGTIAGLAVSPVTYQAGAGWITSAALSGTTAPATLNLSFSTEGLAPGTYTATVLITSTTPGVVDSPSQLTITLKVEWRFVQVAVGLATACGLTDLGAAYCWGSNDFGQLGDGTRTNRTTPVAVSGGHRFTRLSTGAGHSCGITTTNAVLCWGLQMSGQLGDGAVSQTPVWRMIPGMVINGTGYLDIMTMESRSCGRTAAQRVFCWGSGFLGFTGGNVLGTPQPTEVAGGHFFERLTIGTMVTCGTRTQAPSDWLCWGQLAANPNLRVTVPTAVPLATGFEALTVGSETNGVTVPEHFCGVRPGGSLACWGANASGQLGIGTTAPAAAPTTVTVPGGVVELVSSDSHRCARNAAGAVYCWGYGPATGTGSQANRLTPSQVSLPAPAVDLAAAGFSLQQPATFTYGRGVTCAVLNSGATYCWGRNDLGAVGDGTTTDRLTPVRVGGP